MKQAERVAKTKASLVEAFWKLYRQKPLDQISVREITDAAGVYRSTFYLYYQDAATVLAQLEDELEARLAKLLENTPAKSSLGDIPALMALFYKKEGSYLYPLLGANGDRAFAERIFALIRPAIEESAELEGQSFDMAFRFVCEGSVGLIASCYKQRRKMPLDEVADAARALIADVADAGERSDSPNQDASETKGVSLNEENADYQPHFKSSETGKASASQEPEAEAPAKPARKRKKAAPKPTSEPEPAPIEQPEDDDIQMALF